MRITSASPQHTSKFETKGLFNTATVALHTGQAEIVWNGKQTKPNLAGIRPPGAVSVALVSGALRYLFLATATDNPWADFALLRFQNAIANVREVCAERTATIKNLIAMRTASTSVTTSLVSRQTPHVFELVLYTPYHGLLVQCQARVLITISVVKLTPAANRQQAASARKLWCFTQPRPHLLH